MYFFAVNLVTFEQLRFKNPQTLFRLAPSDTGKLKKRVYILLPHIGQEGKMLPQQCTVHKQTGIHDCLPHMWGLPGEEDRFALVLSICCSVFSASFPLHPRGSRLKSYLICFGPASLPPASE
jgi:hypothetical protein